MKCQSLFSGGKKKEKKKKKNSYISKYRLLNIYPACRALNTGSVTLPVQLKNMNTLRMRTACYSTVKVRFQ